MKYKKILLFLLLFIFFVLLGSTKVFASIDFTYNNTNYSLHDPPNNTQFKNYFIDASSYASKGIFYLWGSDTDIYAYQTREGNYTYTRFKSNSGTIYSVRYVPDNNNWSKSISTLSGGQSLHGYNSGNIDTFKGYVPIANFNFPLRSSSSPDSSIIDDIYSNFVEPSITTNSLSITDWDFTTLDIDLGSVTSPDLDIIAISYNGTSHILGVANYYTPGVSVIHIPIQDLNNLIVFSDEGTFEVYYLDKISLTTSTINRYQLGMYNVSITVDKANELNEQADRDIQNDIYNQQVITNENLTNINNTQQETNEKIDEIKDTITDDTVESGADDLPSTDVSDPSQSGIDNIFQSIYNAFCVGQAQDIVFPIPFTNKNITLSPYYVRDMLNNNGVGWVYTLIQAFWGYLIGRYIVKDISKKITKIKGGDIENIENENIKEDML